MAISSGTLAVKARGGGARVVGGQAVARSLSLFASGTCSMRESRGDIGSVLK